MNANQPRFVFVPETVFAAPENDGPMDETSTSMAAGVAHMGGAEFVSHLLHGVELAEAVMQGQNRKVSGPTASRLESRMDAHNVSTGSGNRPGVWIPIEDAIQIGLAPSMVMANSCTAYEMECRPKPLNIKGDEHSILHKLEKTRVEQQKKKKFKR